MPVPSLSVFVLIAAAISVRNGSMASACTFGSSSPSTAGRCECSDAHNDSNPRSSSATASSDGEIAYSVNHIVAPNFMTGIAFLQMFQRRSCRRATLKPITVQPPGSIEDQPRLPTSGHPELQSLVLRQRL